MNANCLAAGLFLFFLSLPVSGDVGRVAVLEFELKDLTLKPNVPEELERTASLGGQVRAALRRGYGYTIAHLAAGAQQDATRGVGYLFDHPDAAAALGRREEADWVVVGRVHKPSFLFVYLKVRVVDARAARLVGDFIVEIKGQQKLLTPKGVARIAQGVDKAIGDAVKLKPAAAAERP